MNGRKVLVKPYYTLEETFQRLRKAVDISDVGDLHILSQDGKIELSLLCNDQIILINKKYAKPIEIKWPQSFGSFNVDGLVNFEVYDHGEIGELFRGLERENWLICNMPIEQPINDVLYETKVPSAVSFSSIGFCDEISVLSPTNLSSDKDAEETVTLNLSLMVASDYPHIFENIHILPESSSNFNTSEISSVSLIAYCQNGTFLEYDIDKNAMSINDTYIECELRDISIYLKYPSASYGRRKFPTSGVENMTFYMIDLFQTPYIVDVIYFSSELPGAYVVLYDPLIGNLDYKSVDLSNKVTFYLVQNKEYQLHVYDSNNVYVRSIGNVASSNSETFYVSLDPTISTVEYTEGMNITYTVTNTSIKVVYTDPTNNTDWVRLEIWNASDDSVGFNSTVANSSVIFTYNVNTINQSFKLQTTYSYDGFVSSTVRYIRNGEVITIPSDIPSWLLVGGIAFILVAIALVFPAGVGG
ncbi:MAG TPA: hypothetical protein ENK70_07575, partial [Methylophaga sp.]|nr:hypothetical protein [Methylophaga sp.]